MGRVDTAIARMDVDGDSDVGVARVHDVGSVAWACHEGAGERCDTLTSADVLADLGPTAGRAGHNVSGMGQEAAIGHLIGPAIRSIRHRTIQGQGCESGTGSLLVKRCEEARFAATVTDRSSLRFGR